MSRITALLFIGLITFILVLLATNPDLFEKIYLYFIGLAGVVIEAIKGLIESIKKAINGNNETGAREVKKTEQSPINIHIQSETSVQKIEKNFHQPGAVG